MKTDATLKSDVLAKVMNQAVCCGRSFIKGNLLALTLLFSSTMLFAQTDIGGDEPLIIVKKGFYPGDGVVPAEVQESITQYALQQSISTQGETEPTGVPPTIENCPADQEVECFSDVGHVASELDYTINCGPNGIIIIYEPPGILETGSCPGTEYTVTYDVWDQCGNNVTCDQIFTIENPGPEITSCPAGGEINSPDEAVSDEDALEFTFSCPDDPLCSDISVTVDLEESYDPCLGDLFIYTYTITDACGRSDQCEQVYNILPPDLEVECSDSEVVECASDISPSESDITISGLIDDVAFDVSIGNPTLVSGVDNCSGAVYEVVYTVSDDCEREASCTRTYTLENEAPTITAPEDVTIECASDAAADIAGVSFTTSCELEGEVTAEGPILVEGDGLCDGSLWKFVYTVTDACERTATAEQMVTISNQGPSITAPEDVTIECAADAAADIDGVTFTTSCDFEGVVTAEGPILVEGDGLCDGSLWKFIYTVTDDCERTATAEQMVTISNNGPSIDIPADVTIDCEDSTEPSATGMATAIDPCEGDLDVSFEDVIISEDCPQIIERTWSAINECEVVVSGVQTITITDEEAPVFDLDCEIDFEILTSDGFDCPSQAGFSFEEGDEFSVTEGYTIAGVDAPPLNGCVSDNCTPDDDLTIRVASISETGDDCNRTFTVDFEAIDNCGNVGSGFSCNYTIIDDQAPELILPEVTEGEVSCSDVSFDEALAFAEGDLSEDEEEEFLAGIADLFTELGLIPTGTEDDCNDSNYNEVGIDVVISDECPSLAVFECIFVAVDVCGNVSEPATTTLTLVDNTAPTISCPDDITINCDQDDSPDNTGMATASDDCSDVTLAFEDVIVSDGCPTIVERTFTATDECGLTATCTQEITILFDEPTIVAPEDVIIECASDAAADIDGVSFTTGCDLEGEVTAEGPILLEGDGFCDGSIWQFIYSISDDCGRSATDTQMVTISNSGPSVVAPDDVEALCIDFYVPNPEDAVVTTSCELGFELDVSDPVLIEGQASCNLSVYEITYTVTDDCGRTASDIQVLTSVNGGLSVSDEPEDLVVECYEDIVPDPWAIEYFSPCSSDVFIQVTPPTQLCCTEDCPGAEYSVIYTITNDCGDEVVVEQIFVIDNEGPTILSCGEDQEVESIEDIEVSVDDVEYETACGVECDVAVVSEPEIVDNGCDGTDYIYTYTITDNCGRTATCERVFTIPSDDPTCLLDDDCNSFTTFYADIDDGQTTLYSVDFTPTEALLTYETEVDFGAHIAFDAVNNVVYLVNSDGSSILAYDPTADTELFDLTIGGNINQLFAVVYNPMDQLIYLGDANDDEIFTIDPLGLGDLDFFANAPVEGGDLAIQDGTLYLVNRGNTNLYTVVADADGISDGDSEATLVNATGSPEISGMAPANNETDLILSNAGTPNFTKVNAADASTVTVYMAMLDGDMFELADGGDMAAGCANNFGISPCDYRLYYTHNPEGSSDYSLLQVELDQLGNATYTTLLENLESSHIGLSNDGSEIYIVGGNSVRTYDVLSGVVVSDVDIYNGANNQNLTGFPAAVVGPDDKLYIAGAGNNVWECNPATGQATNIASGINVNGGDLIWAPTGEDDAQELWIITRNNGTFTRVLDPLNDPFSVEVDEINGAAVLENGNVLLADGDGNSLLKEVSLSSGDIVATYDIDLPLFNGDLAGSCTGEVGETAVAALAIGSHQVAAFPSDVYPNPAVEMAVITFEPAESARTTVELYDMSGRPMQSLFNAQVKAGLEYRVNVNTSVFENGVYIYRVTNGSHQVTKKLMIVD